MKFTEQTSVSFRCRCAALGLNPSVVGKRSVGNARFDDQLSRGRVTFRTWERVNAWLDAEEERRRRAVAALEAAVSVE